MGKWTVILLLILSFVAYEMGYLPIDLGSIFSFSGEDHVEPFSDGSCPNTHPVKASFTASGGQVCIYHMRGQRFYDSTRAERCYGSEGNAKQDGCSMAKDPEW